jgi:hypothetical protein
MQMFVAKTLTDVPVYKAFGTSRAAQRWAESGAYREHNAEQSEIYRTISGLNSMQAIAAVKIGKAEHLLTIRRRADDGASLIETTRH